MAGERSRRIIWSEHDGRREAEKLDRRKLNWVTIGVVVVAALAVGVMLAGTLHRSSRITLPSTDPPPGASAETPGSSGSDLTVIQVTPQTVQTVVGETLTRPETYRRTITVEQYWNGGSGSYDVTVTAAGGWTRTDRTMPDGRARHTITGTETVYVWYNNGPAVYAGPAGAVSADAEQTIPTYEDILALSQEAITAAEYCVYADMNCIYVETAEDPAGYVLRYWVSVDTGLLVAAEKLEGETVVYRMTALTADQTVSTEDSFVLPDGTRLISPS